MAPFCMKKHLKSMISGVILVAEVGFEPHDLRVMSPTSYQAALLRDIVFFDHSGGAGDRDRTGTMLSHHGILSPGRLPVPPHRQIACLFGSQMVLYHILLTLSTPFLHFHVKLSIFCFFKTPLLSKNPEEIRCGASSGCLFLFYATKPHFIPR